MLLLFVLACAGSGDGDPKPAGAGGGGEPADVELRLQPPSLEFGTVIAGTEVEQFISVGNQGSQPVELTARIDVDLPQAFAFEPASMRIAPGDYENVRVVFKPEAWAVFDGALVLTDASGDDVASAVIATEVQADRDGDGYGADRHGGPDCDDDDPDVNPDGSDVWYDGVDGDCDYASDYDADGDGYDIEGGSTDVDCDDTDPDRHPGVAEVWYDGFDADCAGDDDYDADGDGAASDAYGGTDCLDDDPRLGGADGLGCLAGDITPSDRGVALPGGVGFGLDAIAADHDSDGWTDLLVAEAERVVWLAGPITGADPTTAPAWTGGSTARIGTADVDGDGIVDLLTHQPVSGTARWVAGPLTAGGSLSSGTKLRTPGGADRPLVLAPAGDVDGDGVGDLALGWSGDTSRPGIVAGARLFLAGSTEADEFLAPGTAADAPGAAVLGPGDLDSDGYDDLLIGAPGGDGQVWLVRGGTTRAADARLLGGADDGLGSALAAHDGDLWVGRERDGALVRIDGSWAGTVTLSADVASVDGTPATSADVDGDGTLDLLTRGEGGAAAWAAPLPDASAPLVRAVGATGAAAALDADGDDWPDLVVGDPAGDTLWLLLGPVISD